MPEMSPVPEEGTTATECMHQSDYQSAAYQQKFPHQLADSAERSWPPLQRVRCFDVQHTPPSIDSQSRM